MTTSPRFRLGVCLIGMIAMSFGIGSSDVAADEKTDKARAQALFLEGRKAIDGGDWDNGCPKVRQSLDLFAVANSHFTVAQCDERVGHIVAALEHWERGVALVDDRNDPRTKVGKERIAALEPRVPRIRVVVPPASASAEISLDGETLEASRLAAPLRVDPGTHVFVVKAPGHQDERREIKIAEGERTEFVANVGAPSVSGPVASGSAAAPQGSTAPPPPMHPRKLAGFVVGGVGLASLLASAGTGYAARSAHMALEASRCNETNDCPKNEVADYKNLFIANAVTLGVGVAGVGAGVILILTAPKKIDEKPPNTSFVPLVMPGGAGIGLSKRF